MSALATAGVQFDPLRDSRHPEASAAREQADWLAWLELGGISPRTLYDYQWATDRLLKMCPTLAFTEISENELLHVFRSFPPGGRRERVAAFKSWFKWGVRTRRLTLNPIDLMPEIKRQPRKVIDIFVDEEIARLSSLPDNNGDLFQILFDTGLRRAEARMLRVRDVHLAEYALYLRHGTKGGKQRIVHMPALLQQRLSKWFELDQFAPSDYLWPTRPGGYCLRRTKPMGDGSFSRWYRDCVREAGVEYRNPHTTRHTYATRWLRRGGKLETLSKQMGHSSIAITHDYYSHLDTSDVLRDLAVIEGGK